jgi:hypothetical protein
MKEPNLNPNLDPDLDFNSDLNTEISSAIDKCTMTENDAQGQRTIQKDVLE